MKRKFPTAIKEIRGIGLMIGMELNQLSAKEFAATCFEEGLLVVPAGNNTIRFLPPLTIKQKQIKEAMKIVQKVLEKFGGTKS